MPLITPPFRTSLLTANGAPFATDTGEIQTAKDWWLYWNQLTDRSNSNSKLASEGAHADRPDPGSMPDGALYYESDRGVLYANAGGVWRYVAGTMWGTAGSPDQRPTDLGTNDVGFDFRTNVSPAREFMWSGEEWIEITPMLYGTHAQRLAGTIANLWAGMAWMETDRGNVIYQNQSFLWIYVAGTMTGTISPDQRPAGLGANDTGFRFETTDGTHSYRWTGSAWVETTPPPGLVQYAAASSPLTLTTGPTTIPGLSVTLPRIGRWLVTGCVDVSAATGTAGDVGQAVFGRLANAGGAQIGSTQLVTYPITISGTGVAGSPVGIRMVTTQQWLYVTSTITETANLQAWKTGGTGGTTADSNSSLSALWVSA